MWTAAAKKGLLSGGTVRQIKGLRHHNEID